MNSEFKAKVEGALSATAERLAPGSATQVLKHAKNDISVLGATQEDFAARYANDDVLIAAPVIYESKQPDGDPVTFKKKHSGIIIVFPGSLLYVREMGFGARDIKAVPVGDVSIEQVMTVMDGKQVPGLRITAHSGKPHFAFVISDAKTACDPVQQAALRDEMFGLLAR